MKKNYFFTVLLLVFTIGNAFGQIYEHNFDNEASNNPYTVAPNVLNSQISNSAWYSSTGGWANYAGASGNAISLSNSGGTPSLTLIFEIDPGYQLDIESYNFWRRRSNSGAQNWSMTINENNVGSGTVPTSGSNIGLTNISGLTNLTGTVTVVISLSGASGSGTFRLDDFILNGTISSISSTTELNFTSSTYSASESDGTVSLCVDISNESATTATTANVVVTSGTSPHLSTTTYPITFSAGSSTQQCVTVSMTDNANCGDTTDYTFELQNISGGDSAAAGSTSQTILSVADNEGILGTIYSQNFDTGSNWTYTVTDEVTGNFEVMNTLSNINYSNITGNFFGINDADDGNNTVQMATVNTVGMTGMTFMFDYDVYEFDNGDDMSYQLFFDGVGQGIVEFVTGDSNYSSEGTISVAVPDGISTFSAILYVDQNGGGDYGAWDNIELTGLSCPSPEITVTGNSTDITTGDTTPDVVDNTNFGSTNVSSTTSHTFTITNDGTADLTISSIALTTASEFSLSGITTPITIPAGNSQTFTIAFTPTSSGIFTDTVTILSDDSDEGTFTFTIQGNTPSQIVLSSNNPATANANVEQASNDYSIYAFQLDVTDFEAILTQVDFTTTGTYAASNLNNFELWYSTDATFDSATDTPLELLLPTDGLGLGNHTFAIPNADQPTIAAGSTGYFFITAFFPCASTAGNTIQVSAITTADITVNEGNKTGFAYNGGEYTITSAVPNNVIGAATSNCENGETTITWSDPTGCFDNFIIVATDGSFTTTIPTGNGLLYTPNTTYGSGTSFDSGYVVYKGTGNSITVTGLTNGTNYTYKIFTRNDTNWSSGIEIDCTPNVLYCDSHGAWNDSAILNVTFNTIDNDSTNDGGYGDYTAQSTSVNIGASYNLSVNVNTNGSYTSSVVAWIDWNQNGDFTDSGEEYLLGTITNDSNGQPSLSPLSILIPSGALLGTTRMRVSANSDNSVSGYATSCETFTYGEVEDYTIEVIASCTPTHAVSSYVPTSGPVGTEVIVTGTGFTSSTTATVDGIGATIISQTSTQLVLEVPSGVATGDIMITEGGCDVNAGTFTVLDTLGSCSTSAFTDLIISEVYDSDGGNAWYMELYNPTSSVIDLGAENYTLERYGDVGDAIPTRIITLSGTVPANSVFTLRLGSATPNPCNTTSFDFTELNAGINENDEIKLVKNNVEVDVVECPNQTGYSILRDTSASGPTTTYNASDWTTDLNEDCSDLGTFIAPVSSPSVTTSPTDATSCGNTATFSATASAGNSGALTYQWYYNDRISTGWVAVTSSSFTGVTVSGENSNTLDLTGAITSYDGYQFYCEVTEDASCSAVTDAAQLKVSGTVWDGTSWSNGTPDENMSATINGDYNTATNGSFSCCTLTINTLAIATVTSGEYIFVVNEVVNNGDESNFIIQSGGSLVQQNDVPNTGNASILKTTTIDKFDYVYWSTPVATFNVEDVSPDTASWARWQWLPTQGSPDFGNWIAATGAMTLAKGYIIRGPNNYSSTVPAPYTANFVGVPNNGTINVAVERGSYNGADYANPDTTNATAITAEDDNWNLIGNPYPSAIDAEYFLTVNTALDGFVNVWTHGTDLSASEVDPFYNNYDLNYTESDYITFNATGAAGASSSSSGLIASGQGFFVQLLHASATPSMVTFTNAMRFDYSAQSILDNTVFYRPAQEEPSWTVNTPNVNEKHRIWLTMHSDTQSSGSMLVGYVTNATYDRDRLYDAIYKPESALSLYSLLGDDKMIIQGRSLPFDVNDQIPLGAFIPQAGSYTIAISQIDGLFESGTTPIYIEDLYLNTIQNVTQAPYTFTTTATGEINDRFVLRYTADETALSIEDVDENTSLQVLQTSSGYLVQLQGTKSKTLENVMLYDMAGKTIWNSGTINTLQQPVTVHLSNAVYIVSAKLNDGSMLHQKIIVKN